MGNENLQMNIKLAWQPPSQKEDGRSPTPFQEAEIEVQELGMCLIGQALALYSQGPGFASQYSPPTKRKTKNLVLNSWAPKIFQKLRKSGEVLLYCIRNERKLDYQVRITIVKRK